MGNNIDFSKITNRYVFDIELKLVTPLHIGGNQEDAITSDNPVIKDANDHAFIPGSSLKGVLRTASDRLAHLLDVKKESCYLIGNGCAPHKKYKDEKDERILYQKIYNELCPICQTYGGGSIASKVKVNHVVFQEPVATRVRTGNKIDRETGAAQGTALFNYEYIQPGQTIHVKIEAENMTDLNLKVLAIALTQLQHNMLRLGGKQAKGLGQIEYIGGTVTAFHFDTQNRQQALALLLGIETPVPQNLADFLDSQLLQEVN